jgi:GTP cyclohydrolase I
MNKQKVEDAMKVILEEIGEDINREGITYTPQRVARLYNNMFYGYRKKLVVMNEKERNTKVDDDVIPITIFENSGHSKEMLIREVNFISTCEHHVVPIEGKCWVGIIPDNKLLGMNKIDKIVKYFAAHLQIQERMTSQIADWINDNVNPLGIVVVVKANHYCAKLQGDEGEFTTSAVRGAFKDDSKTREEFLNLIKQK